MQNRHGGSQHNALPTYYSLGLWGIFFENNNHNNRAILLCTFGMPYAPQSLKAMPATNPAITITA